jgi:hypothetical protein
MSWAARRLSVVFALGCALLGTGSACPRPSALPSLETLTDAQATARVLAAAARRQRMVGTVKAKLPGVQGVVLSVDLDVLLEPPAKLRVEVRSFFETPLQVLVTDGAQVTIFDATRGEAVFMRGPVTASAFLRVGRLRVCPPVGGLVSPAPPPAAARGRLVGVDDAAATYDVWLEAPGHAPCQVTARASDDAIVRWQQFQRDGRPLLEVSYGDLRAVGDAVVPYAWTLTLVDRSPTQTLVFVVKDVLFNGAPRADADFRLDVPPGTAARPL